MLEGSCRGSRGHAPAAAGEEVGELPSEERDRPGRISPRGVVGRTTFGGLQLLVTWHLRRAVGEGGFRGPERVHKRRSLGRRLLQRLADRLPQILDVRAVVVVPVQKVVVLDLVDLAHAPVLVVQNPGVPKHRARERNAHLGQIPKRLVLGAEKALAEGAGGFLGGLHALGAGAASTLFQVLRRLAHAGGADVPAASDVFSRFRSLHARILFFLLQLHVVLLFFRFRTRVPPLLLDTDSRFHYWRCAPQHVHPRRLQFVHRSLRHHPAALRTLASRTQNRSGAGDLEQIVALRGELVHEVEVQEEAVDDLAPQNQKVPLDPGDGAVRHVLDLGADDRHLLLGLRVGLLSGLFQLRDQLVRVAADKRNQLVLDVVQFFRLLPHFLLPLRDNAFGIFLLVRLHQFFQNGGNVDLLVHLVLVLLGRGAGTKHLAEELREERLPLLRHDLRLRGRQLFLQLLLHQFPKVRDALVFALPTVRGGRGGSRRCRLHLRRLLLFFMTGPLGDYFFLDLDRGCRRVIFEQQQLVILLEIHERGVGVAGHRTFRGRRGDQLPVSPHPAPAVPRRHRQA
mmetsp:Transcript_3439/g.8078  ORF Transcript_3439/g.8078 Transcript_3439/m.8078 type:complete len:568 (+) Transcript_3439:3951-5654(+)